MKLILHIGMGKTGTSAIQASLRNNYDALASQKVRYLGMWFDMLSPEFRGLEGQVQFFSQSVERMRSHAAKFLQTLNEHHFKDGDEVFILSNEALSGQSTSLTPFIATLTKSIDVKIICYVRNPREWLPSAYAQWGIRDKVNKGPVQSYREKSQNLVRWYYGPLEWYERFPNLVTVLSYDEADDIVAHFGRQTHITLNPLAERVYERASNEELLLRALFNSQFEGKVLPSEFDKSVSSNLDAVPALTELVKEWFDYSGTECLLESHKELFYKYKELFNIDLLTSKTPLKAQNSDPERMKERLLDMLLSITLDQARRLRALENRVWKITKENQ